MNILYFPKDVLDKAIEATYSDAWKSEGNTTEIGILFLTLDDERFQHIDEELAKK